jgi:hypothetical protein
MREPDGFCSDRKIAITARCFIQTRCDMSTILAFFIGLFVGGSFGTAIIALLIASKDD